MALKSNVPFSPVYHTVFRMLVANQKPRSEHGLNALEKNKSFPLPHWLTLLWKQPHYCMMDSFS